MKRIIVLVVFCLSISVNSQNLNEYKYALVPAKFSFLKEENQYRLNLLTKMFMQKYGFETYIDSETQPKDFSSTNCNKVYVDLVNNSNMFTTKIKVVLKDCYGKVVFTSAEGTSREKEFAVAYNEAVRMAFKSFDELNYKYIETKNDLELIEKNNSDVAVPNDKEMLEEQVKYNNVATSNSLFAQPIANGFQIINSEPKVIYKILKTSTKDFYIATKSNQNGVFISKNGEWFFEFYLNEKLVSEKVDVKF